MSRSRAFEPSDTGLRRLYRQMSRGVVFQDASGAIVSANPAAERILGLSLDQLMGRTSTDPRWRAVRRSGEPIVGELHPAMVALRTGQPVNDELMGVFRPDREEYVWLSVSAFPEREGDEIVGVFTTFEDVSERLWAEEALRASEARYRSLFENMILGIAVHELLFDGSGEPVDYAFLEANEAFGRLTGLDPRAILGKRVTEVIPVLEPEFLRTYAEVARSGRSIVFENEATALGRRYLISAFKTGEGQFATVFDDITERARNAAELARAVEERKALFRELEHRVKNSLSLIASLVTLEEGRAPDAASRAALKATRDRITSLSALYEQLYRGGDTLEVGVDRYIERVVAGIAGAYGPAVRGVRVETALEGLVLPASAAASLGIVVNELVTNALKHGFAGGGGGRILVRLARSGGEAELEVSDDGRGLPEGFDLRSEAGLGTQIVSVLAEQLGGGARAERREPGSAFFVRFPLRDAAPA